MQTARQFSTAGRFLRAGPQMFGYNKKEHIRHFVLYIPLCAVMAWVCTLF